MLHLDGDGFCSFEYNREFCQSGVQPSPLQMQAVEHRIYRFPLLNRDTFCGLPGMLADSLPDSFGRALLDRWLEARGRRTDADNALERLSFQGRRCMGALEYFPSRGQYLEESSIIEIQDLVDTARTALSSKKDFVTTMRNRENMIADILKIGTSAGGQRAKAVIAINEATKEIRSGQVDVPEGFDHWILKFDGFDSDGKPVKASSHGKREFVFSELAKDAGIKMTECRLLKENGRAHFMTRRFDRSGNEKIHMQSLCALAHYDFRMPGAYSYEQAFRVMRQLGLGYRAAEEFFRRLVFNVASVNMDDHTKNVSFLMDRHGNWSLAPAYDIGFNYNPEGQWYSRHQMTVNGKRTGITKEDLYALARRNDVQSYREIVEQVMDSIRGFADKAIKAEIPAQEIRYIESCFNEQGLR